MSADAIKLLKPRVFDKSKWMQLPRDVVIGHDVLWQLPAVCKDLKLGSSALLVSGRGTMKLAGNTVMKILSDDYKVKPFLAEEITAPVIKKAEKAAKGADFLIGVGGGRVIDTAKIVSFNLDLPFISVPTAASHDGIASARASVAVEGGNSSLEAQPPVAIVADTGIIASAPHRLLAAGCADVGGLADIGEKRLRGEGRRRSCEDYHRSKSHGKHRNGHEQGHAGPGWASRRSNRQPSAIPPRRLFR